MSPATLDHGFSTALRAELAEEVRASAPSAARNPQPHAGRRRGWRNPRVAIAATAATIALVAAGALLPTQDRAYAGWSATPAPLRGEDAASAAGECAGFFADPPDWELAAAERRGSWTLTILLAEGEKVITCHARDGQIGTGGQMLAPRPPDEQVSVVELTGISSGGEPWPIEGLWPRDFEGHHIVTGRAGASVTDVVLDTSQGPVTASLSNGLWAAWWPMQNADDVAEENLAATVTLRGGGTDVLDRADLDRLHEETLALNG